MATVTAKENATLWRLIVVGGHTRSIGKTQLVCDVIRAFPRTEWIAGKITQYGHGVCARNGENCDCAPTEHVSALEWETRADTGTDSSRFLEAGAKRSFWLRTKQGYLAEGLPLLRDALDSLVRAEGSKVASDEWRVVSKAGERNPDAALGGAGADGIEHRQEWLGHSRALIVESNSLMQFVRPSLYFAVIDPLKDDFKESAQTALDRAHALVLRGKVGGDAPPAPLWLRLPTQLMKEKPSVLQREGEPLPSPLWEQVHRMLEESPSTRF
jgi:hypothetical protein